MSFPDLKPATRREQVTDWFKQMYQKAKGEKWLYVGLLIFAALIVGKTGNWFLGHLALTVIIVVPTFRWFTMRNKSTRSKKLRRFARLALVGFTLVVSITGGISDSSFETGVMFGCIIYLATGFGWVKREVLLAILIVVSSSVFMDPEIIDEDAINGVVYMVALLITAGVLGKQWKVEYAAKQARMANRFVGLDQSQRPVQGLRPTGGKLTDRLTDPVTDVSPDHWDRREPTGEYTAQPRTEAPYADYPPAPPHMPTPGARGEQEEYPGEAYGRPERLPRPKHLPPTGRRRVEETGEHPTGVSRTVPGMRRPFPPVEFPAGTHPVLSEEELREANPGRTVSFSVPEDDQQDGQSAHRRRVPPPEGGAPQQG